MPSKPQGKWDICLQYIQQNLPEDEFQTWFTPLQFFSLKGDVLTLSVPRKFVMEYIVKNHRQLMQAAAVRAYGGDVQVLFHVEETAPSHSAREAAQQAAQPQPAAPTGKSGTTEAFQSHLSPNFTFENFVEGKSNKLARAVALSIAKQPGKQAFNPFFIYGASGVGKTHLVNAIGMRLRENQPDLRVLFVPANIFKVQFTDASINNKSNDFIHFYQTIDVLIIDDVQEIRTAKTQQAFFHIFNHLQLIGKQIILTCDKSPAEVEGMEERMLTRFKSGMVAEMEKPDVALRRAILQAKIRRDGLKIPKEVIDFIATTVESSVRELQGIINTLMMYSVVDNCDITLEMAERIVARAVNLERREITVEDIIRTACRCYGLKQKDLLSKSRKQDIVKARQIAMYLAHKYTDLSYAQIGHAIGKRDHSTVLHACNQVAARIATDKTFRLEVEEIESKLKK